jgi:hypothetical protein
MDYAPVGGECSVSRPCCFTPRESAPLYSLDRRLNGPQSRCGRLGQKKILDPQRLELRPLRHPARSQPLYRLSYPTSHMFVYVYVHIYICARLCVCVRKDRYVIYGGHHKQKTYFVRCSESARVYNSHSKRIGLGH